MTAQILVNKYFGNQKFKKDISLTDFDFAVTFDLVLAKC